MSSFVQKDGALVWNRRGETVRLSAWGRNSIRVNATMEPELSEELWALLPEAKSRGAIRVAESEATITNGLTTARIGLDGRIGFLRSEGSETLLEEVAVPRALAHRPAREHSSLGGHLYRARARFAANPGERLYGLGQHQHGLFDLKGATVALEQENTEVSVPLLVSSRRYAFFWNNPAIGRVEIGTNGTTWHANKTRQLDYLVFAGRTPAELMREYCELTGFPPMMPEYAAGFWQSKLRYENQEELLSVAREYRRRGLPLSVIVVDFFHWTRMGDWRFDPVSWPDPAGMMKELARMGVEVMVSVWPTVSTNSDNFAHMRERNLLVRSERGSDAFLDITDTDSPGVGHVHFYDATSPEARAFVWEQVKKNYHDHGVKIFWLDASEPEIRPFDPDNLRYAIGNGEEVGCIYPMLHERGFYEGMLAAGQKEILNLCRSAWAGSQRYGAAVWSGDIDSTFAALRTQVVSGLNMAMSGIPWWTTDIGGFYGGSDDDPVFRELVVRWFQYAVFCPLFRLHGFRNSWDIKKGGPNEAWSFGEEAYGIIKEQLLLRERIKPYVLDQMRLAHASGAPAMRPLFFDFPDDPPSYEVGDEFMFGPDLLVAPVVEHRARERRVYLPEGESWRNAWTGEVAKGGSWREEPAPLERIPVFIRSRSKLDLRP